MSMLPEAKLDILLAHHASLEAELLGQVNSENYVRITRELAELNPLIDAVKAYRATTSELADIDVLIADPSTEAATHGVQRVPDTETQGRIHTAAATVAVLPEVEDVDVEIKSDDLRIETMRAQGAGGQHVNKTESAIRITHIPTGIVVSMQDSRSQHKNRASAMNILRSRIYDAERQRVDAVRSPDRRERVGSGDRSERIRTYNFPQGRVTDHRINLTLYKLPQVISGEALGELIDALTTDHQAAQLAAHGAAA